MQTLPSTVEAAIEASAQPRGVRVALEWLAGAHPGLPDELDADPAMLALLVVVLGASPALARLVQSDPGALQVLREEAAGRFGAPDAGAPDAGAPDAGAPDAGAPGAAGSTSRRPTGGATGAGPASAAGRRGDGRGAAGRGADGLVAWARREQLRIAARDLGGLDDLETVGRNLASLADAVLTRARELGGTPGEGIAVVAMGKAGARELNYASDVDVVLAGEGDPRPMLELARRCFRVDLDLRPEGRAGPLVRSLDSYLAYFERWAQAWERQAMLKARVVAGPEALGAAFASAATSWVWGRAFDAEDLRQLRSMKARAEGEVARRRLAGREIKRGPGGIRDVEFAVQLLQLIHGQHDGALRVTATMPALRELARAGYVDGGDAAALEDAYRFLRTLEHRLQLAEMRQTHTVPVEEEALQRLARVLDLRDDPGSSASAKLLAELRERQRTARDVHERLFFRPLLEAFSAQRGRDRLGPGLSPGAAGERLAAFGFADGERARAALVELTRGLTRSSRMMQALLPLMLGWLSDTPDPDLGLGGLRRLAGVSPTRRDALIGTFRDSPEVARRACVLLGTSPLVHEPLRRDPALLDRLATDGGLGGRGRADLLAQARETLAWRADRDHRQSGLRRFVTGERAVVMAADVLGEASAGEVGRRLAELAEATLEAALEALGPRAPMAVIGVGRLGGAELAYGSDLDVLLVLGPADAVADGEAAERDAERWLRFVNGETPARRIATLDLRLRPEGRHGPLARSVAGFGQYYRRWAGVWERQALLRARPVAGDPELARRFMALAAEVTLAGPIAPEQVREIRRLKARVETERLPPGDDPAFHVKLGPGGLADVEWTVQLLQLTHGVPGAGTLDALDALVASGAVGSDDATQLRDAYRTCELLRNRAYLVQGGGGDALPSATGRLAVLARSLGTSAAELRDRYRQVTRRARRVTERLFYGLEPPPARRSR